MAIAAYEGPIERPVERPVPRRLFRRPIHPTGLWDWFTTIDHKKIGLLYLASAFAFFIVGGLEALIIRLQLGGPNGHVVDANTYNQIFTMHGTTMIFLVVMPLSAGLANYLVPLMIGARDVAFPRLNAFGYWVFIIGGLFMYSSFLFHQAPNGGWFGYAPNTTKQYNPGHNIDFWVFGLQILGIASLTGAINLIVTIINMRAPGMSLMRMPIFVWMTFIAQMLLLFAIPVITVALFELMFDRLFGANFFNIQAGADPLLWEHLFWIFGHPEVYILILPAMGIVSEVLPVFCRRPLFGYPVMVFSGIAIAFMGWGVWAHHMFSTGLGPVAKSAFALSTMFIAVPTGVKIFNWMATMAGGKIRIKAPFLFAVGFVTMFTIGGLSGVTHAVVPADTQQTDTYYIVAHFHYVLFGGSIFGLFAGAYYWWPKFTGKMLSDRLGKWQFWIMLLGFNLTFGPFHILGLQGMPRRIYRYPTGRGWDFWNLVATIGSFIIAFAVLLFIINVVRSRKGPKVAEDPWDARTLEWSIPNPPPEYNFAELPIITHRDELWHRKYTEDEQGRPVPRAVPEVAVPARVDVSGNGEVEDEVHEAAHEPTAEELHIHMPTPSYFPLLTAIGLPIIAYGLMYKAWYVSVIGALILLASVYGWALEPATEPEEPPQMAEPAPAPEPEPEAELEPAGAPGSGA
ncbi:MAG: cytochrome c oxidase subunit I [Acidimicrobiia bacterium]|nr:cytochrome c oxidase subunit I [Acidimicrobiia bacterium]